MADGLESDIFSTGNADPPPQESPQHEPEPISSRSDMAQVSEALRTVGEPHRVGGFSARLGNQVPPQPQRQPPPGQPGAPPRQPGPAPGHPEGAEDEPVRSSMLRDLLQERDRRQALERELERHRGQQPPQPQQPAYDPDQMFVDPKGFYSHIKSEFQNELQRQRFDMSLNFAAMQHGEKFGPALNAFLEGVLQQRNPQLYFRVWNSPNPGAEIMRWHREVTAVERLGDDPEAYDRQVLERALDNPEFLGAIAERLGLPYEAPEAPAPSQAREQPRASNGQFTSQPRNVTRLPPSLSRVPGASRDTHPALEDGSEEAIFAAGRASPRARGR